MAVCSTSGSRNNPQGATLSEGGASIRAHLWPSWTPSLVGRSWRGSRAWPGTPAVRPRDARAPGLPAESAPVCLPHRVLGRRGAADGSRGALGGCSRPAVSPHSQCISLFSATEVSLEMMEGRSGLGSRELTSCLGIKTGDGELVGFSSGFG